MQPSRTAYEKIAEGLEEVLESVRAPDFAEFIRADKSHRYKFSKDSRGNILAYPLDPNEEPQATQSPSE